MIPSVRDRIPHRPPFLFLDEVLELSPDRILARRLVQADEPQFAGHYPGHPIMPGVLLCEACFQAGAVLLSERLGQNQGPTSGLTPILVRISEAKFKRRVHPGDQLEVEARYKETVSQFHFLRGRIQVEGRLVLSLDFTLALVADSENAEP